MFLHKTNQPISQLVPSGRILRKMGLTDDQNGIMNRYIDEEGGWNHHLNMTKSFIIDCIEGAKPSNVAILGSGWLLDVPVKYFKQKCLSVYFYDLHHPKAIRHKYRKQENFRFIDIDITGGLIQKIYDFVEYNKGFSPIELHEQIDIPLLTLPFVADYTVSLNILSQIDSLIVDYMQKYIDIAPEKAFELKRKIQQRHIELLKPGASCLITDFEEVQLTKSMGLISAKPIVYIPDLEKKASKKWDWHFDTKMTYNQGCLTHFKVMAIKF